jgi:hypothetical protein
MDAHLRPLVYRCVCVRARRLIVRLCVCRGGPPRRVRAPPCNFAIPPQRATAVWRRTRLALPWLRGGNAAVTMTTLAPSSLPRALGGDVDGARWGNRTRELLLPARVLTGTAEEDGGVKDASSRSVAGRPSVWRRRPFSPRTPFACKKRERLGWAAGTTIYNIDPQRTPEEPMEAERRGRSEGFFDVSPSIRIQQRKTSSQRNQTKIFYTNNAPSNLENCLSSKCQIFQNYSN